MGAFRAYNTLNYNQYSFLNNSTISSTSTLNSTNSTGSVLAYNHIWEIPTDFYLHNLSTLKRHVFNSSRLYTRWYDEKTFFCLPRACNEVFKGVNGNLQNLVRKKSENYKLISNNDNVESQELMMIRQTPIYNNQMSHLSTASNLSSISNATILSTNDLNNSSITLSEPPRKLIAAINQSLRQSVRKKILY